MNPGMIVVINPTEIPSKNHPKMMIQISSIKVNIDPMMITKSMKISDFLYPNYELKLVNNEPKKAPIDTKALIIEV